LSVVRCPWEEKQILLHRLPSTFTWPLIVCPTSLSQGNQLLQQFCSGRACRDAGTTNKLSIASRRLSMKTFRVFTSNFQLSTSNSFKDSQPITGHFRQKGARRHLPDPVNSKSQICHLRCEIPIRSRRKNQGCSITPFLSGRAWERPCRQYWVGIADGLQAILISLVSRFIVWTWSLK